MRIDTNSKGFMAALPLTLGAIRRGCYAPRLACVVLLQVLLDAAQYRALADTAIAWLNAGLRERNAARARKLERA